MAVSPEPITGEPMTASGWTPYFDHRLSCVREETQRLRNFGERMCDNARALAAIGFQLSPIVDHPSNTN
jgi:hypothetical protein